MDPRYWTKSVELELGGLAQVEIVRSTHQAATALSHWPRSNRARPTKKPSESAGLF
ncbi:hypothetical protein J2Y48_004775 [Mycoplana sp. BE70]|uniref:DUF982 domain-containing protein n=1 Tax=Mycoplana sp. BE70 TaxID=2817775 RepID=UPI00285B79E5|nr:hypothetical protein [Mycoplana sp. BE70]